MRSTAYRARYVFPVSGPPIADGAVTLAAGQIVAVGRAALGGGATDLGNVALLPGLVNAHTHLEFSDLDVPLGKPGTEFVDWIRAVMAWRKERDPGRAADRAVARGLAESARCGTTTLGEIAQPDWSPAPFENAEIQGTVFLELIGSTTERVRQAGEAAARHVGWCAAADWTSGLAPHAPYSVSLDLLRQAVSLSQPAGSPIAMHLAESREELELLRTGGGPFRDLLQELGIWTPGRFGGAGPLEYLKVLSQADRALVIHGNHLAGEEIEFLAGQRRMALVYCPRTHAYFGHAPYPLGRMLAAGVTVALGTDSRASSPDLSLLAEMRHVARQHPEIEPRMVLELGTLGGARALGRDREIGTLEPGKRANLIAVSLPDRDAPDPHELLFDSDAVGRVSQPVRERI